MPSSHGIFIEIIGDAKSYLRAAESTVAANTKMDASFKQVGVNANLSADAQVKAATKTIEVQRAQVAALRATAAKQVAGSDAAIAANVAVAESQAKLNRSLGLSSVAMGRTSTAAKTGERDLNKLVRGGLAGSGAFSALGRSLAFASSGFIAFAAGATLITKSIEAARSLAVAQRQVNRQLQVSGKTFAQYKTQIDGATTRLEHLAGFTHVDLLSSLTFAIRATGNVGSSLKLMGIAADVARGRGISLQSAMIALTKAVGGSSTALRRLGIIVPKTAKGWDAINFVAAKFRGQAAAGATVTEKFGAVLNHTEEIIGQALLPTVNKLVTSFGNWLQKMNATGRLQKDVNTVVHDAGAVFHTLESVIKGVDDVTGSFVHTLEALVAFKFASMVAGWTVALEGLAVKWGVVTEAATAAGGAQGKALATGEVGAGAGAGRAALGGLSSANIAAIVAAVSVVILNSNIYKNTQNRAKSDLGPFGFLVSNLRDLGKNAINAARNAQEAFGESTGLISPPSPRAPSLTNRNAALPLAFGGASPPPKVAGAARQAAIAFKAFTDTLSNQLAQARAALTTGTADDVAAAKAEIAFIKKEIAKGHLKGQALLQALGAEASAISTIQSAEAAAAQKRAAAAQAAAAKIQAEIQNSIDPLKLEVALSKAQALHKPILAILRKLRRAAQTALASGKLSLDQQKQAWDQITSLNQQIAAELKKHKKKTQDAANAFKQASTRALTAGLGLSAAQRAALRARLSQLGPGGTVPGSGVGAAGFIIDPTTGRPIHIHNTITIDGAPVARSVTKHQQRHRRRNPSQRRGPHAGYAGG